MTHDPESLDCPVCKGAGGVMVQSNFEPGDWNKDICPMCEGEGKFTSLHAKAMAWLGTGWMHISYMTLVAPLGVWQSLHHHGLIEKRMFEYRKIAA